MISDYFKKRKEENEDKMGGETTKEKILTQKVTKSDRGQKNENVTKDPPTPLKKGQKSKTSFTAIFEWLEDWSLADILLFKSNYLFIFQNPLIRLFIKNDESTME